MTREATQLNAKTRPTSSPTSGILQRKCACGNQTIAGGECVGCAKKRRNLQREAGAQHITQTTLSMHNPIIQPKLTVGAINDPLEQEADRVADKVLAVPAHRTTKDSIPRIRRSTDQLAGQVGVAPTSVEQVLVNPGGPLDTALRHDMESRFGYDFSQVRVHSDAAAEQSARDLNAHAYTSGNNIVFGQEQFAPGTHEGRRLIAHELTHVVQQKQGIQRRVIQRRSGCSANQDTIITDDHARARNMLSTAIAAVSSYNGTAPTKVLNALSTHFHGATSNAFAAWINVNLRFLWGMTWMAEYECYTGGTFERIWACGPNDLATTFWCVPGVDIRLCPSYFSQSDIERSTTMIHEWVHKYGCNFDLGYEGEPDYPQNWTVTQLLNADSFSSFIRDVQ